MEPILRPIDAALFLERGRAMLGAAVPIATTGATPALFNGVRLTAELVLSLELGDGDVRIGGQPAERVWSVPQGPLVLRTARSEGDALPELALAPPMGLCALVFVEPVRGETMLGLGRLLPGNRHDAPRELGASGAPVFDATWAVVGLHQSRPVGATSHEGAYVPIATLLRALEDAPCWSEIAETHRLVRTATAPPPLPAPTPPAELALAVRWDPDDDDPLPTNVRRRALHGATLDELRAARGDAPATGAEQRAVDRILAGPPFDLDALAEDEVLPFATAMRWFEGVVSGLPDAEALERHVLRRRRVAALDAIVGPHFAARTDEVAHLRAWLARPDRPPLVVRGPGGIGKSALLAHFVKGACPPARFAWIDFDRADVSADEASIRRVVDEHLTWQPGEGPLIVVLDSFETAVQTYGYTALVPALDALAYRFPDLAVVVGSRTLVPLLTVEGQAAEDYDISGLDPEIATNWLVEEGLTLDVATRAAFIASYVPLNLRLARDLLTKAGDDVEAALADLPKELVGAYLFRRILRRLKDPELKDLAPWAMVPRRLVPELLRDVLRVPAEDVTRVFDALRSEVTLLEGEAVLTLRPDLRNTLLPLLREEDEARVTAIDSATARFWAARAADEVEAAAEAVYHFLRVSDFAGAERAWRPGVGSRLRGYAPDELPAAARPWLEARATGENTEGRVEDLLSRGRLVEARAASTHSHHSRALSHGARVRRLLGFVEGSDQVLSERVRADAEALRGRLDTDEGLLEGLESIVLQAARPVLRVRDGNIPDASPPWQGLNDPTIHARLQRCIRGVGRLQVGDDPARVLGTATHVGNGLFLTTRSAADAFCVGVGHDVRLLAAERPRIELRAEGDDASEVLLVARVVLVHPVWDIAVLGVSGTPASPALPLETAEPTENDVIAVVGHPAAPPADLAHIGAGVYGGVYDVKRLGAGRYRGRKAVLSRGLHVLGGGHDASSVCPDPGAAVVAPISGRLLGVTFANDYLVGNTFVPAWELARDRHVVEAGVALAGEPEGVDSWASAWGTAPTHPSRLLDAYVAWRSGDAARAAALIDLVPTADLSPRDTLNRTLLVVAGLLEADPDAAGALLEGLADGGGVLDEAGRAAIVATRLRLCVDAEAERVFLDAVREDPNVTALLTPWNFHVLSPPGGDFQWNREAQNFEHAVASGHDLAGVRSRYPATTLAAAERVLRAHARCERVAAWANGGNSLYSPHDLVRLAGTVGARSLFAGFVAMPDAVGVGGHPDMLEVLGLDPHAEAGWTPILVPLMDLFHAVATAPEGVSDPPSLHTWLREAHASGRLGTWLARYLQLRSPVPWVAGLYHLLTPLPLHALLERRFTTSEP